MQSKRCFNDSMLFVIIIHMLLLVWSRGLAWPMRRNKRATVPSIYPLERLGVLNWRNDILLSLERIFNQPLCHADRIELAVRGRLVSQVSPGQEQLGQRWRVHQAL